MPAHPAPGTTLPGVRRALAPTVSVLLAAALVGLLVYGLAARADNHSLDNAVAAGRLPAAPGASQSLPALEAGGRRTLASYRGQVVVVNFWASWCDPCRAEAPLLQRAQATLAAHRATILGITFRDTASDSQAFVRQYHLTYPSLRDVDGSLAASFATKALPETFVLDRQGRVAELSRGEVNQAFVDRAIALAERA